VQQEDSERELFQSIILVAIIFLFGGVGDILSLLLCMVGGTGQITSVNIRPKFLQLQIEESFCTKNSVT